MTRQEARSAERPTGTRGNSPAEINRRVNDAAEALGKARAAHERKPTDRCLETAMLEAEIVYLKAELARRDYVIGRERRRNAEIGLRFRKAQRLLDTAVRPARAKRGQPKNNCLPLLAGVGI
jgi:hypothetical protein